MRIVAVTRALNEEDIVEPLIRHHAALVDHHIVLDNGSADRTLDILAGLAREGASISILQNRSAIFSETQFNTFLYRRAVETHRADWVLYLDADEFVDARRIGDLRNYLAGVPPQTACVGAELVNYDAPSPATDDELNVVRRFTRRPLAPTDVWKAIVRGDLDPDRVTVDAGNHSVLLDGELRPLARQTDFALAHYPSRSPYQWAGKAAVGRLKVLAAGQRETGRGRASHYTPAFDDLRTDPKTWLDANARAFEERKTAPDLIDDPIDYLGGELRYTRRLDYAWRAFALALGEMEKIATRHGAALDLHPDFRAETDANIDGVDVVFHRDAGSEPCVADGAIVGQTWRDAADPTFASVLGRGWVQREGRLWGVGDAQDLYFHYQSPPADRAEIEAVVEADLPEGCERLDVDLVVMGHLVGTWVFTHRRNLATRMAPVARFLIAATMPTARMELRPRFVAGGGNFDDGRRIGVGLRQVRQRIF